MLFKAVFLAAITLAAMFWGVANSDAQEDHGVEKRNQASLKTLTDVVKVLKESLER